MPLTLEIITGERRLLRQEDVDEVIAPGALGELGILPHHAPLITSLVPGELRVKTGNDVEEFYIGGGFLEVHSDEVTVLADAAEHGGEIDAERAEAARQRALERLEQATDADRARAQAALARSLQRLRVLEHRRRRGGGGREMSRPTG